MRDVLDLATDDEARRWAEDRLERRLVVPAHPAEITYFAIGIGVAGRDHAYRTARGAIEEGCELVLAGLLLEGIEEEVRYRTYAKTREEVLKLEAALEAAQERVRELEGTG